MRHIAQNHGECQRGDPHSAPEPEPEYCDQQRNVSRADQQWRSIDQGELAAFVQIHAWHARIDVCEYFVGDGVGPHCELFNTDGRLSAVARLAE